MHLTPKIRLDYSATLRIVGDMTHTEWNPTTDYDDNFDNDPQFNVETGEDYPTPDDIAADYYSANGAGWDNA